MASSRSSGDLTAKPTRTPEESAGPKSPLGIETRRVARRGRKYPIYANTGVTLAAIFFSVEIQL